MAEIDDRVLGTLLDVAQIKSDVGYIKTEVAKIDGLADRLTKAEDKIESVDKTQHLIGRVVAVALPSILGWLGLSHTGILPK